MDLVGILGPKHFTFEQNRVEIIVNLLASFRGNIRAIDLRVHCVLARHKNLGVFRLTSAAYQLYFPYSRARLIKFNSGFLAGRYPRKAQLALGRGIGCGDVFGIEVLLLWKRSRKSWTVNAVGTILAKIFQCVTRYQSKPDTNCLSFICLKYVRMIYATLSALKISFSRIFYFHKQLLEIIC